MELGVLGTPNQTLKGVYGVAFEKWSKNSIFPRNLLGVKKWKSHLKIEITFENEEIESSYLVTISSTHALLFNSE